MHFHASKFQKFLSIIFIKIVFQGVLNTGSKRKVDEWRKENTNTTNVESQIFFDFSPMPSSSSSENSESDIDSEVEHV